MAMIQRQVDIVLQNRTPELLTIENALATQGDWLGAPPVVGAVVPGQGAARWCCGTPSTLGGTSGFLTLGSTKGYLRIDFELPHNVVNFRLDLDLPEALGAEVVRGGPNLDHLVMLVVVTYRPNLGAEPELPGPI